MGGKYTAVIWVSCRWEERLTIFLQKFNSGCAFFVLVRGFVGSSVVMVHSWTRHKIGYCVSTIFNILRGNGKSPLAIPNILIEN